MNENNNHNKNNKHLLNPFSFQYPAAPEYFADRTEQMSYFSKAIMNSARIRPPAPSNFMVLGDWGMGKTSLLYKMKEYVLGGMTDLSTFCFHFSLDPLSCKNWDVFCLNFLTQLRKSYEASSGLKEKLVKEISKWKISFSLSPVSIEKKTQDQKPSLLDNLEDLWNKHLVPSGVDICLLFLDDIHYFLQADQSDAYYTIRNTFQELARRQCNFSLIVSGPEMLHKAVVDLAEPFLRFFHPLYLEPFSLDGTREAIAKRIVAKKLDLKFSEEVITDIHKKSEGHPYFIMFIAYELTDLLSPERTVELTDFVESWPQIVSRLENTVFVNRLGEVPEKEREVLLKIALIEDKQVSPSMVKGVKGTTQLFARLETRGLLFKKERGLYELFHPLFKEYLSKVREKH